jgi:arylsulfatase
LFVDGEQAADDTHVDATHPMIFSPDETCDVGSDTASPVSDDYDSPTSQFTGTINWVQLEVGQDSHDHLISPEDRIRLAMARQ